MFTTGRTDGPLVGRKCRPNVFWWLVTNCLEEMPVSHDEAFGDDIESVEQCGCGAHLTRVGVK